MSTQNLHADVIPAAFPVTVQAWKQRRCPSVGECVERLCCIHTVEYYSALQRMSCRAMKKTWRNPEGILLSERSPSETAVYFTFPTT